MVENLTQILAGPATRRELYAVIFVLVSAFASWELFVVTRFLDSVKDQRIEASQQIKEERNADRDLSARITRMNQRIDAVVSGRAQN